MVGLLAWLSARFERGAFAPVLRKPAGLLCILAFVLAIGFQHERANGQSAGDPPVPPGIDPGGVPVALVGHGIDYRAEDIRDRLARDGEGEITGFDFVDNDRRPFGIPGDSAVARVALQEGRSSTLIVVRTDFSKADILGPSLRFAAQSPARIIAMLEAWDNGAFATLASAAARYFPEHLFLAAAGDADQNLNGTTTALEEEPENLLVVTAATPEGEIRKPANTGRRRVDIAVTTESRADSGASLSALARVAALAARLKASEPDLSGKALKARIVGLAEPLPSPTGPQTRRGWIRAPQRLFWAE